MNNQNILEWLQTWYKTKCNDDWEHSYGVTVETLDNPGWKITVDLAETNLESLKIEPILIERSDNDWYSFKVKKSKFYGYGDPSKLEFILKKFKEIVNQHDHE